MRAPPLRAATLGLALAVLACKARTPAAPAAAGPAPPAPTPRLAPAGSDAPGYDLRPAERAALAAFLQANPDLRSATDDDRRRGDGDDVTGLYGIYHPYFVRGDVNDDGILDFVLGFVRRDSDADAPWFSVAVFTGEAGGGFAPGVFLERDISLADGDLALDRDAIVVTPDLSDESTRRYRWDPERRRHVFVRDEPEEQSSPPASQT